MDPPFFHPNPHESPKPRFNITMSQKFLDRAKIIATLEQMSRKWISQDMARGPLSRPSLRHRNTNGLFKMSISIGIGRSAASRDRIDV